MPCRDGGPRCEVPEHTNITDPRVQAKLDDVTRMLCALCESLDNDEHEYLLEDVTGLKKWWEIHEQLDAERKEKLRMQALAKLTPDEREALGYK